MAVSPDDHRGSDLRRTFSVRRKAQDPRTPGRTAGSAVAAGVSGIMRARMFVPCLKGVLSVGRDVHAAAVDPEPDMGAVTLGPASAS